MRIDGPDWFYVSRQNYVATVSLFGEIGVYGATAKELVEQVGDAKEIHLIIDSPGGFSGAGFDILDGFGDRVSTATVRGKCFSTAVIVAMGAKRVRIRSDARFMIHSAQTWFFGSESVIEMELK